MKKPTERERGSQADRDEGDVQALTAKAQQYQAKL